MQSNTGLYFLNKKEVIKVFNLEIDEDTDIVILGNDYCFGNCFQISIPLDQFSLDWKPNFIPLSTALEVNTQFLVKAIEQTKNLFPNYVANIVSCLRPSDDDLCLLSYLPLQEPHKQILKDYYENNLP